MTLSKMQKNKQQQQLFDVKWKVTLSFYDTIYLYQMQSQKEMSNMPKLLERIFQGKDNSETRRPFFSQTCQCLIWHVQTFINQQSILQNFKIKLINKKKKTDNFCTVVSAKLHYKLFRQQKQVPYDTLSIRGLLNSQLIPLYDIQQQQFESTKMSKCDDQISLMHSIIPTSARFCNNLYWDQSEDSQFAIQMDLDSVQSLSNKSHKSQSNEMGFNQKEDQSIQMNSTTNSSSNLISQCQSSFFITGIQQKLYRMGEEGSQAKIKKEQKYNQYCLGHIDYITSCSWSLYGSSRKYQRSKKGKGSKKLTQLEAIAKRMKSFKGKRLDTGYPKRFDQELNKNFRKLKTESQDQYDITPESLRNIIQHLKVGDNQQAFRCFINKCESQKHWSMLLRACLNQKRINCEEDLNK